MADSSDQNGIATDWMKVASELQARATACFDEPLNRIQKEVAIPLEESIRTITEQSASLGQSLKESFSTPPAPYYLGNPSFMTETIEPPDLVGLIQHLPKAIGDDLENRVLTVDHGPNAIREIVEIINEFTAIQRTTSDPKEGKKRMVAWGKTKQIVTYAGIAIFQAICNHYTELILPH